MKVLSIDLDYIMGPVIELYNGLRWDSNALTRWENLYDSSDFRDSHWYIDQASVLYCYKTFLKALKNNPTSVTFGYEHDHILYELSKYEKLDIINIDHHDDITSSDFDEFNDNLYREYNSIVNHDRVHEGNWVAWLHAKEKLNSYTWIHNKNSRNLYNKNDFNVELLGDKYNFCLREDYKFEDYKFDHIFVCLSPQYIPKNHWHYFTMFMMAYEEFTDKKVNVDSLGKKKFETELRHNKVTDEILYKRSNDR